MPSAEEKNPRESEKIFMFATVYGFVEEKLFQFDSVLCSNWAVLIEEPLKSFGISSDS